jgi:hypothetical protein
MLNAIHGGEVEWGIDQDAQIARMIPDIVSCLDTAEKVINPEDEAAYVQYDALTIHLKTMYQSHLDSYPWQLSAMNAIIG